MSSSGNFPLTFRLQVQGDAEVQNKFKQVATAMGQIQPAATKASQSTKQVETTLKSTGQAATQSSSGLKTYGGALTSLGSANTQAKTGVDAFTGSLGSFNTTNKATVGGLNETNTVTKGLVPTVGALGNEGVKTQSKMQRLTDVFQGNKGLIFSTTMLSSGIFEAIGMYQGWQDASEKLATAKEKEADLIERGMEGTKEYGDAVNEVADAQRGYNFITRFTIQSFADLIPMTLMLTSSLISMSADMGGLTAVKTKLAAAGTKLVGVLQSVGTALMALSTGNKILLLLGLIATAVVALIKNWGGFRDAVNGLGKALGDAIAPLQSTLQWIGLQGNAALDTADSYLTYGEAAAAASTDVEKAVLKTGDATVASYSEQIELMGKLGDEAGEMAFSLGAHLKKQEQDEESHNQKYKQFAEAMTTGNEEIMKSLGLTTQEFADFSKTFQDEVAAMDETWNTAVESMQEGWKTVGERGAEASNTLVSDIIKIEDEIVKLEQSKWDMDKDEDIEKVDEKIGELYGKLGTLQGGISDATLAGARDFHAFGVAAKQGLDSFTMAIQSQDFNFAIDSLSTAIDAVPEKYQGNFAEIDAIIGNSALTQRQKVAQIVSDYGSLEQAFKPLIVGAYELSKSQADVAANLDEVAVAARNNMTSMDQAKGAWDTFYAALTPAQKQLPMITDLMARLQAGTITHAEALQEAEAAGRSWSEVMNKDVATSIKNVQKTFIDMGDGTKMMVANVNGQMVNLGRISNTELGKVTDDLGLVKSGMESTGQTAGQSIGNEATAAVGVFGKDGQFHFGTVVKGANDTIDVFKAVNLYADTYISKGAGAKIAGLETTMTTTGSTIKTETSAWNTSFEGFATAVKTAWDSVVTALNTEIDLGAAATALVASLNTAITKEFPKLVKQGGEIVTQVGNGIMQFAKTIETAAEATINHFSTGTMKKYQEIVKIGGAIVDQVSKGVTQFAKTIVPSAEAVVNNFVTGIQKVASMVLAAGKGLVTQIGAGIEALFPQLKTKGNATTTAFRDSVVAKAKLLLDAGKGLASNIISGINAMAEKIKSTLMAPFTAAKTAIENLFKGWDPIGALGGVGKQLLDLLPKIPGINASDEGQQVPVQSLDQLMGNATGKGVPGGMNESQVKALHAAWSSFSTSMATYSTSISASILKIQTAASTLSTSMATYVNSMKVNIGSFITTTNTQIASMIAAIGPLQTVWSTLSTSIATYANSMKVNISGWVIASLTQFSAFVTGITALQGSFSTLSTSVSTYMNSMKTNIAAWGVAAITAFSSVSKNVLVFQGAMSKLSTSVATYMTSMKANTAAWGTASITALSNVSKNALTTQSTLSKLSTSVATYSKSMSANLKSFSSSAVSSFNAVTSAANKLVSALNKVAAAARKAAAAKSAVGGMQHGGSFVTHAQKGFSGIVDRPTTYKGVRMGEGFGKELVTVQPLTRGTGNHIGPTVSSGGGAGSGGTKMVEIHIHNEMGGREVSKVIKKVALEDAGLMV